MGAGSIELRKDGQFYHWSIFNNYPLGTGPVLDLPTYPRDTWQDSLLFFLIRYQVEGQAPQLKLLQLNDSLGEAAMDSVAYYYPWLSAVQQVEYAGRFPFAHLRFTDEAMPFEIELEAFSPFIPHDVKHSSLPGVYFNFSIKHTGSQPVDVLLLGTLRNLVGYETLDKYFIGDIQPGKDHVYMDFSAGGMQGDEPSFGHMGLASLSADSSWYCGWEHRHPYYERLLAEKDLPNVNVTDNRNKTDPETGKTYGNFSFRTQDQRHFGSIGCAHRFTAAEQTWQHSFALTWHFPNAYGSINLPKDQQSAVRDMPRGYDNQQQRTTNQGHYYAKFFADAQAVAAYLTEHQADLSQRSRQFVADLYASDLPQFLLDQLNSQLNTFATSSTLTQAGKFAIREGLTAEKSWGPNATIDVSLYGSVPITLLFPTLARDMLRAHRDLQQPSGEINHGLGYDLDYTQNGTWGVYHRVDMPGNYLQLVLRDAFWMNDRAYLEEMWPSLKKAADYLLTERDPDGDGMPDMDGIMCSYDNFPMYGLASYIQSQWLASLAGMVEAAKLLGDKTAEKQYRKLLTRGTKLMDQYLWNGEYYRLYHDYRGDKGQDEGCLSDQLIGQWLAHQMGLGYLLDQEHVQSALRSVLERCGRETFLCNCAWPEHPDYYPMHETDLWVDQANTPWTGVELGFVSFLLYEGMYDQAMDLLRKVDTRYRKNGLYWDHQEFGGHYYRSMSAWAILGGLLGLSLRMGVMRVAPVIPKKQFRVFFAWPQGTGHFVQDGQRLAIEVRSGSLTLEAFQLKQAPGNPTVLLDEQPVPAEVVTVDGEWQLRFPQSLTLPSGSRLSIG
jgi:uncharacterized protein (DUF608 family)